MEPSDPVLEYPGRDFSGEPGDFDEGASQLRKLRRQLGGDISIAFTARWDSLDAWSYILCLGSRGDPEPSDLIRIFNRGCTGTLTFEVSHGRRKNYRRVDAPGAISIGEPRRFLCTAAANGRMCIYRDGELLSEVPGGWAPLAVPRNLLCFGSYAGRPESLFCGLISDLRVWDCLGGRGAVPATPPSSGLPQALLSFPGRHFTGAAPDVEDLAPTHPRVDFGGAFSVAFTARWDNFSHWGHVLCFAAPSEGDARDYVDAIRVFGRAGTRTLTFEISHGARWNYSRCDAEGCLTAGEPRDFLCSITEDGHMRVYADGELLAEELRGWAPQRVHRSLLLVGGCADGLAANAFSGWIGDVRAWASSEPVLSTAGLASGGRRAAAAFPHAEVSKQLRRAADRDHVKEVRRLLWARALVQAADGGGKTALHYAARGGAAATVRLLLESGADPNAADGNGERPLDEAEWWSVRPPKNHSQNELARLRSGCREVAARLVASGAECSHMHLRRRGQLEQEAREQGFVAPWLQPEASEDGVAWSDEVASSSTSVAMSPSKARPWAAPQDAAWQGEVRRGRWGRRGGGAAGSASEQPPCEGGEASRQIVLNCANLGHMFAKMYMRDKNSFGWRGVHLAVEYYRSHGVTVHAVCKDGTIRKNPIPDEYEYLSEMMIVPPPVDVFGKDEDDLFTLRIAQVHNCQFVDNDNYRDWKKPKPGCSHGLRMWLLEHEANLRVTYIFNASTGQFVPHREPLRASRGPDFNA